MQQQQQLMAQQQSSAMMQQQSSSFSSSMQQTSMSSSSSFQQGIEQNLNENGAIFGLFCIRNSPEKKDLQWFKIMGAENNQKFARMNVEPKLEESRQKRHSYLDSTRVKSNFGGNLSVKL